MRVLRMAGGEHPLENHRKAVDVEHSSFSLLIATLRMGVVAVIENWGCAEN